MSNRGLTLIETIITVSVLSLLSLIIVPSFVSYNQGAIENTSDNKARAIYTQVYDEYEKVKQSGISLSHKSLENIKEKIDAEDIRIRVDETSTVIAICYKDSNKWYYYPNIEEYENGQTLVPSDTPIYSPEGDTNKGPSDQANGVEKPQLDFINTGDIVAYQGERYICLKKIEKSLINNPAELPEYFRKLSQSSEWIIGKIYYPGDLVIYNDIVYICYRANEFNQWDQPNLGKDFWKEYK